MSAALVLDERYQLIARAGSGGMGTVYRALHLGIQKVVAVKLLPLTRRHDPRFVARFRVEAQALGRLEHSNVVRVTDFGFDTAHGTPFLVMEYLEGVPLSDHLARRGALAPEAALPLLAQIAAAIDYAHGAGILHRDLKASNVLLLDAESPAPRVKVVDFGLAGFLGTEQRAADVAGLLGTPAYLAPEIWEGGEASSASDLWAFGVLAYAVLAGSLPFPGPGKQRVHEQVARGAPRPSRVNPALDGALDAALLAPLAADPAARPRRASEVVAELRRALAAEGLRRWRARELPRRLAAAALLAAAAPLALLAAGRAAPVEGLENRAVDLRFSLASPRPARRDLVLLLIDEPTLASDPTPLAAQADAFGRALRGVFASGARGAGLDLLLPQSWGRSESFSDLLLRHAGALALAAFSPPPTTRSAEPVLGPEVAQGLVTAALGPERVAGMFGFVDVVEDGDGRVRRAPPRWRGLDGRVHPSFAARAAAIVRPGNVLPAAPVWLDGTIDGASFERISWRALGPTLARDPRHFAGRFVLVGGEFAASGDSSYRIPHPRGLPAEISGVALQGVLLQTLLDGEPVRSPRLGWVAAALAAAAGLAGAAVLLGGRLAAAAAVVAGGGSWLAAGFWLFTAQRLLVPLAAPLLTLLVLAAAAAALRLALPRRPAVPE
jgi:CHASE2 domain-containing sensor protein